MKWVECIIEEGVWTAGGKLNLGGIEEVPDDLAETMIGRGQVIETVAPPGEMVKPKRGRPKGSKNKPKAEGADAPAVDEEI